VAFLYLGLTRWAVVLRSAYAIESSLSKLRPGFGSFAFLSPLSKFGGESLLLG